MPLDFLSIALPLACLVLAAGFAALMTLSRKVDPKFQFLDSLLRLSL